jgi:hypothetical protein
MHESLSKGYFVFVKACEIFRPLNRPWIFVFHIHNFLNYSALYLWLAFRESFHNAIKIKSIDTKSKRKKVQLNRDTDILEARKNHEDDFFHFLVFILICINSIAIDVKKSSSWFLRASNISVSLFSCTFFLFDFVSILLILIALWKDSRNASHKYSAE